MIRTIPALLRVISVAACGSDGGSERDEADRHAVGPLIRTGGEAGVC